MEWYDIEVDGRHTVKFADLPYVPLTSPPQSPGGEEIIVGLYCNLFKVNKIKKIDKIV